MIECPEFRSLLLYLREDLTEDDICGRDKLKRSIMEAWYNYYIVLKDELEVLPFLFISSVLLILWQEALGKISYTADAWSSASLQSYLAITAHWAYRDDTDGSIKIKARLIAFHKMFGRHTGERMAQLCIDLLDRAGITANVRFFLKFSNLFNLIDLIISYSLAIGPSTTLQQTIQCWNIWRSCS